MTTARSSFSLSRLLPVYRNMLRRNRGSAFFYGALGFISLPAQYLLTILQNQENIDLNWVRWSLFGPAKVYNGFAAFFFTALMLLVPLIMAVNLFSYLHNRRSVDVHHSLPLTRFELYAASTMAGLTLIWVPLAVNFLLAACISFLLPGASVGMILLELLCWMVITLAIFSLTAFCAVQLGTDFDTVIFSLGLNGVFAAVYLMFMMLASSFIYGFSASESVMRLSYRLSPVSLIIGRISLSHLSHDYIAENNLSMLIWLLVSVLVLLAGAWVYSRRKSEQAEAVGEMRPLQVFMRSAGTLLGGTALGMIFSAVFEINFENNKLVCLLCIAIGSMIVYFIGDVILSRSVRSIPKALPIAAITTAGVCVLVGGMLFDLFGIARWTPAVEQVGEARLYYYESRFSDQPSLDRSRYVAFTDPEAVALVIAAQKEQVDQYKAGMEAPDYGVGSLRLEYVLADGRTVNRRYYNLYLPTLEHLLELEVDDELISQSHPAFEVTSEMLQQVNVTNILGSSTESLTLTADQKQRLLVALREDLLSQPLEELKNGAMGIATLSIELKYPHPEADKLAEQRLIAAESYDKDIITWNGEFYYNTSETLLTESYRNTLALLREFGASTSLENNWSDVKAAYALPFNRNYENRTIAQTDLNRVSQTQFDLEDFLENYADANGMSLQSFALSPMELAAARTNLRSMTLIYDEPFAVLGVAAGEKPDEITGYYLVPLSTLPEHLKQSLAKVVEYYYGSYAVESWGYGDVVTITHSGKTAAAAIVAG